MRTSRAARHVPGLDRRAERYQLRTSDLILAITAVLLLVAACLRVIATAAA